jgi:hypothetical protein
MPFLTKASGTTVSFTEAELAQITVQLAAAGQARCSGAQGITHVLVGTSGLLSVDSEWVIGRRLLELHTLEALPANPFGLVFSHGAAQRTLHEALLASGFLGSAPATLADVYMLQTNAEARVYLAEGQLVAEQGVFDTQPAVLKTLVAGANVTLVEDEASVTISSSGTVQTVQPPLALANGDLTIDLAAYATVAELAEKQNALAVEEPLNLTSDVLSLDVGALQAPDVGGGRLLIHNEQVLRLRAASNLYTLDQFAQNCLDVGVVDSPGFDVVTANAINLAGVDVGATLTSLSEAVADPYIERVIAPLTVDEGALSINLGAYALDSELTSLAADVAALETGKQDVLAIANPTVPHQKLILNGVVKALSAGSNIGLAVSDDRITIAQLMHR